MASTDPRSSDTHTHEQPAPIDWNAPQLTLRSVLTGMILGAVLCTCNIYAGLKIGWGFNMSVTAALLSFGFWNGLHQLSGRRVRHWGILENNINQTACSSAASVSSAGLVAPIPALAMLTGQTLDWAWLALWCFSVMLVGITVAIPLRRQMIVVDKLPFAFGIAAAETLREMYARGSEALARVAHLVVAALVAAGVALLAHFKFLTAIAFPLTIQSFQAAALTISLKPSLLLVGVGGLIGFRACVSLLLGAILAYGVIAPPLIHTGHLQLQVAEPLDRLPGGLSLHPGEHPQLTYDYDRHQLVWSGVMTHAEMDELLGWSDYGPYRHAIQKLHARSQLAWTVPLQSLPPGVDLTQTPLQYDSEKKQLSATTALTGADYDTLLALSDDAAFGDAVRALYDEYFQLPTVRYVQISVPLEEFPRGFVIPRDLEGVLRVDHVRHRLELRGPFYPELEARLLERLRDYRETHPNRQAAADALRDAVLQLEQIQNESHLPADVRIPGELDFVSYDDNLKALRVSGVLSPQQADVLRDLVPPGDTPAAQDFRQSIERLISASAITPAEPNLSPRL